MPRTPADPVRATPDEPGANRLVEIDKLADRVVWTARLNTIASMGLGLIMLLWPRASVLAASLLLGLWLLLQGVARILETVGPGANDPTDKAVRVIVGVLLIVIGAVTLRHPGASVTVIVVLTGAALVIGGVVEIVSAIVTPHPHRWARGLVGLLSMMTAVLILTWPEPTVGVFVKVAGACLVVLGAAQYLVVRMASIELKRLRNK